ncbi:unnamed protein product, partial [Urochloa humidicola]
PARLYPPPSRRRQSRSFPSLPRLRQSPSSHLPGPYHPLSLEHAEAILSCRTPTPLASTIPSPWSTSRPPAVRPRVRTTPAFGAAAGLAPPKQPPSGHIPAWPGGQVWLLLVLGSPPPLLGCRVLRSGGRGRQAGDGHRETTPSPYIGGGSPSINREGVRMGMRPAAGGIGVGARKASAACGMWAQARRTPVGRCPVVGDGLG